MPSQQATSAAVLNAAPLSLLLSVLFLVVVAMCGPSTICVPDVMVRRQKQVRGNNLDPDSNSVAAQRFPISDAELDAPWLQPVGAAVGMEPKQRVL